MIRSGRENNLILQPGLGSDTASIAVHGHRPDQAVINIYPGRLEDVTGPLRPEASGSPISCRVGYGPATCDANLHSAWSWLTNSRNDLRTLQSSPHDRGRGRMDRHLEPHHQAASRRLESASGLDPGSQCLGE